MGLKRFKPVTPGRRHMVIPTYEEVTKTEPEKKLTEPIVRRGGRNNFGHITARHRGGGHKRLYRLIDFKRNKDNVPAKVVAIEYDPNRTARIALLQYYDGEKRYILWPEGLKVGDIVMSGENVDIKVGNCLPLERIPLGVLVHNVELHPGRGGQLVRAAGAAAQVMAKEGDYVLLRMPSGELRYVHKRCRATIGQVGNLDHMHEVDGKAGRQRWKGWRPEVRGVAMNPVDHPHGGGEGRQGQGRHPKSPWGWLTLGVKTRPRNKYSDKYIVQRRKKKKSRK